MIVLGICGALGCIVAFGVVCWLESDAPDPPPSTMRERIAAREARR